MKRGKFMICKNCSANIDDNVAFCPYCGAHMMHKAVSKTHKAISKVKMNITTKMSIRAVNIFITVSKINNINSRM